MSGSANRWWSGSWLLLVLATLGGVRGAAQGTGYWHTQGNRILDANGTQVRIAGINWYGFETSRAVVGGLTAQDYKTILQTIKAQGYNTIRVPFSNQMVEAPGSNLNISYSNNSGSINSDLQGLNSLQVLDKIIRYAGTVGLKIILDNHRSVAGDGPEGNGLWFTSAYPESAWINDWTMLATRYSNNPTVIGFDLRNEPHNATSGGACWNCGGTNDWLLAATRAGNAVLAINPKLLIFVEGVDAYNNDFYWWGGNLEGVRNSPITLSVANQLVYSPHDYGPSVYGQPWFNGSTTYSSLSGVWTKHWAYIAQNNIAPVWLGEFGTGNNAADAQSNAAGSEGQWFQSLVQYLQADPTLNWTYWALNGEDSLALLDPNYDATPVSSPKQSLLAGIQFPLKPGGGSSNPPGAPSGLKASAVSSSQINLAWTASSTSSVTYTILFGINSGSIGTVLASGIAGTNYQAGGLNPSTTYYFVVKAGNAGGTSAASNQASATTLAPVATGAPSNLSATAASSTQVNLAWSASPTAGVTYNVYQGTTAGSISTQIASGLNGTSYQVAGLSPATTYYFTVRAVASGAISGASNPASAKTMAASANGGCHIMYVDQNDWGTGFTGNVSITNSGSTPLTSWTLSWSYAGSQQLNQAWNSNYSQAGHTVTLTNASWNSAIAPGATLTGIGFNATYNGANINPGSFTFNGVACR